MRLEQAFRRKVLDNDPLDLFFRQELFRAGVVPMSAISKVGNWRTGLTLCWCNGRKQ